VHEKSKETINQTLIGEKEIKEIKGAAKEEG
jgi:hypothetical protein